MRTRSFFPVAFLFLATAWAAAAGPFDVRLAWTGDPASTQTVSWTTDALTREGYVQLRERSGREARTVQAPPPEPWESMQLWSVELDGLTPGRTYVYRVGDGADWSPEYSFRTAPAEPGKFRFLVFGDTSDKDRDYTGWGKTARAAFASFPDARFALTLGDVVARGQFYEDWAPWIAAAGDAPARVPFLHTVAKDECSYGQEYAKATGRPETGAPRLLPKLWKSPPNGPPAYRGLAYSFDYGDAHIVSIPSQFESHHPGDEAARDAMAADIARWLGEDLAATSKPWKIVLMHVALYPTLSDRGADRVRRIFQPVLEKHGVDVVFDAHSHCVARTWPIRDGVFGSFPADGVVCYTVGTSQPNPKKDTSRKIWHAFAWDGQTRANYLAVTVSGDKLRIETFLDDNTPLDRYVIDKEDPFDSTLTVPPARFEKTHAVCFGSVVPVWYPPLSEDKPGYGGLPFRDDNPRKGIPDLIPNGEWCFDIRTLAVFLNGVWDRDRRSLTYDDMALGLSFPPDTVHLGTTAGGHPMDYVSEKGLEAAGFEVRYDDALNLWFIERTR
ncbi:MAG: metallophosphoesterase family protein [Acidobacteria bacterium]|nr:metallophosphoesterase family protein [Acidobacteriota bacterium]